MKLLVVDDEPIILNGIIRMIQKANTPFNEIAGAADGYDALQKLADFQPDLILTDIHMPEMDGLALIKEVQARNLCDRFVILTGYGDFDYARQALRYQVIDYLLKPINKEELLGVLERVVRSIREEQEQTTEFELLLLKEHILYHTPFEEMPLKPYQLHNLFPHPYTIVIVIQAYEGDPILMAEWLHDICDLLTQYGSQKTYKLLSRSLRQAVLIVNGAQIASDEELQRACVDLFKMKKATSGEYCLGISGRKSDKEFIREQYMEAMAAMLFNRYFPPANLTVYKQMTDNLHSGYNKLALYIEHSLVQQVSIEQIEKDMQPILMHFSGDAGDLNKLRERFLICICVYLQSVGLTPEAVWGEHAAARLFASSGEQVEGTRIAEIVAQLIRSINRADQPGPHVQAIDKIVAFVERNYKQDLSLDAVAEHMQMHPNYISMLFRKEKGQTFLHYLHTFRLAKAKQFMQDHPEWPINAIAELVGYDNPRHFFKVFKKFENVTPGQFRLGNG
ncbi:response regulator [Paenibacillus sp. GCM10027628]|uniref:response regulator n=1 Tax=Paenibacillus sp. GCM10027628 TaxID=3273413 RepID=UPI003628EBD5